MAFRLKAKEPVEDAVRRVSQEQVDKAIANIDNQRLAHDEIIHRVRKHCKRIRAALRLIQPVFSGDYQLENAFFRDTADELSGLRDTKVLLETFDKLIRTGHGIDPGLLAAVRRQLVQRSHETTSNTAACQTRLARARKRFCEARRRSGNWKLNAKGFNAIEKGLLETYARGRKGMSLAYKRYSATAFHDWRKHASHHRYHVRLLRRPRQPVFKRLLRRLEGLCGLLGKDHDLALLRAALTDKASGFGTAKELRPLLNLIEEKSAELRAKAKALGKRIYARKPKQVGRRFRKHWSIL